MFYRKVLFLVFIICTGKVWSQNPTVSPQKMQEVYDEIKTPHKYGLVMIPSDNSKS